MPWGAADSIVYDGQLGVGGTGAVGGSRSEFLGRGRLVVGTEQVVQQVGDELRRGGVAIGGVAQLRRQRRLQLVQYGGLGHPHGVEADVIGQVLVELDGRFLPTVAKPNVHFRIGYLTFHPVRKYFIVTGDAFLRLTMLMTDAYFENVFLCRLRFEPGRRVRRRRRRPPCTAWTWDGPLLAAAIPAAAPPSSSTWAVWPAQVRPSLDDTALSQKRTWSGKRERESAVHLSHGPEAAVL